MAITEHYQTGQKTLPKYGGRTQDNWILSGTTEEYWQPSRQKQDSQRILQGNLCITL